MVGGLVARARSLWSGLRRPERLEAEMDEEMRFHIDMEAERLVRERGLPPAEARRRAAAAFGGVEKFKEEGRDVRGVTWVAGMALDLKLGWRMLARSPGLTLVGGLGMAVAVAFGAGFFAVADAYLDPRLPLPEGDRIVALENWDTEANNEWRRSLHDFAEWRGSLRTVEEVGAFRMLELPLVTGDAPPAPVAVAEMTAEGFRVPRVPPLLGRHLVEDDEREGAPPVVVIGHDEWRARFGGDPEVLGRAVQLGTVTHTVVGVMPPGFAFPMDHSFWTPLRADAARYPRGEGPEIFVFGRLAPGVTMAEAQAELEAVGRRTSVAHPATHARIRPRVFPYTRALSDVHDVSRWGSAMSQLFASLLLVVVAVNVAVLVFARTAARRGEIAVRAALGASRRRIVAQLFAEALVLSAGAAVAGLALTQLLLRQARVVMQQEASVGFWMDFALRPGTVLYAAALAVVAALIVGVVPALQSTGRRLQADLRHLGGSTGIRFGRTWTVLIVAQVAVAVAVLPSAMNLGLQIPTVTTRPVYPAGDFLVAGVGIAAPFAPGTDAAAHQRALAARFGDRMAELERRLAARPEVAGVTFAATLPGHGGPVEVEGVPAPPRSPRGHRVNARGVGPGYFPLLGARVLSGRGLEAGDAGPAGAAVVVNRSFAREVLGGADPVGRRIRHHAEAGDAPGAGPWHEIVGVVEDLHANPVDPESLPGMVYYPVAASEVQAASVVVRFRGGAAGFAPLLRETLAGVDPALKVGAVRTLAEAERPPRALLVIAGAVVLVMGAVLLLSAAGIHALMSFTVTQRRKEIGIRAALGADPRRLLRALFTRALGQLAAGAAAGVVLGGALLLRGGSPPGRAAALLAVVAALMLATGLLATWGPARRGLAIQPMEALRVDA